ncbi:MAG: class I SAM-dependent methyltransferase [Thermoplasmata archaeon]
MDCLKVPKSEGERIRRYLIENDMLYREGKIKTEEDHIFLPIEEKRIDEIEELEYEIVDKDLEIREKPERDYKELLEVPQELEEYLPASYDIIGDIALVKIPDELEGYQEKIGEAILGTHKNLQTVFEDRGVYGEFRTRDVRHIAGDNKTDTLYREYGAEFEVDVEGAYFSPRLATERWRVVEKTQKGESILDMFAGVGPYTVLIGRNVEVEHISSIDINPKAVRYLKKNVRRNGLDGVVTVYEGDAEDIAPRLAADRIIMNLPHSSRNFIGSALSAIEAEGTIHYYEIVEEEKKEESLKSLIDGIEKEGYTAKIIEERDVRTYSASKVHVAYDILAEEEK